MAALQPADHQVVGEVGPQLLEQVAGVGARDLLQQVLQSGADVLDARDRLGESREVLGELERIGRLAEPGERLDRIENPLPAAADRIRLLGGELESPAQIDDELVELVRRLGIRGDAAQGVHECVQLAGGERDDAFAAHGTVQTPTSTGPPKVRPAACRAMIQSSRNDVLAGGGPAPLIFARFGTGNP